MKPDKDKQLGKIVARAWSDPEFKEWLIRNPERVLREYEIEVPRGTKIIVVEDTEELIHVNLPPLRRRQ